MTELYSKLETLVYPWVIVIDGDTKEYCRVGKKDPGAW